MNCDGTPERTSGLATPPMSSLQVDGSPWGGFFATIEIRSRPIRSCRERAVHWALLSWRDIGATCCVGAVPDMAAWPAPEPPPTYTMLPVAPRQAAMTSV